MKRLGRALFAALALTACLARGAAAETRAVALGGGGEDALTQIAVSADGRIALTGATDSTDGTFSRRTTSGRIGCALCADASGSVLWSYCARLGEDDFLREPVFHEDGSLSLLLQTDRLDGDNLVFGVILLDRDGQLISRRTVRVNPGEAGELRRDRVVADGYALGVQTESGGMRGAVYGWDGALLREYDEAGVVVAASERHALREAGGETALFSVDAAGEETRVAAVAKSASAVAQPNGDGPGERGDEYYALVSLEDGGAAAVGRVYPDGPGPGGLGSGGEGIVARWDASGERAFEWWMPGAIPQDIARTAKGFAVPVMPAAGDAGKGWTLQFLGEDGVLRGRLPLEGAFYARAASLPDGGAAVLTLQEREGNVDARLTLVPAADLP